MNNADKPIHVKNGENIIHSFNSTDYSQGNFEGLTKREYFAGLAMQGFVLILFLEVIMLSKT